MPRAFDMPVTLRSRALGQQRPQLGEVEQPVVGERDVAQGRARHLGGHLPRHDVRVVLHLGEQDLVALTEVLATPALGDEVRRLGRASGEHDRLGLGCAEEPGHDARAPS